MEQFIEDEELDRQLREAVPYIDDKGFTARVLKQLPTQTAPMRVRGVILVGAAVLASMLAYFLSGGGRFVSDFVVRVSELPMLWLLIITFVGGLVVGAFGLIAAVFKMREAPLFAR
jgi:hypothetical protein